MLKSIVKCLIPSSSTCANYLPEGLPLWLCWLFRCLQHCLELVRIMVIGGCLIKDDCVHQVGVVKRAQVILGLLGQLLLCTLRRRACRNLLLELPLILFVFLMHMEHKWDVYD